MTASPWGPGGIWPLLNFTSDEATAAVRALIGPRSFRHVLVTPPLGPREPERVRAYASARGVELLKWPDLLREMMALVSLRKNARNPTDHLLRVLRVYGLLPHTR